MSETIAFESSVDTHGGFVRRVFAGLRAGRKARRLDRADGRNSERFERARQHPQATPEIVAVAGLIAAVGERYKAANPTVPMYKTVTTCPHTVVPRCDVYGGGSAWQVLLQPPNTEGRRRRGSFPLSGILLPSNATLGDIRVKAGGLETTQTVVAMTAGLIQVGDRDGYPCAPQAAVQFVTTQGEPLRVVYTADGAELPAGVNAIQGITELLEQATNVAHRGELV